jgi:ADP-ribose pyrophosphatase
MLKAATTPSKRAVKSTEPAAVSAKAAKAAPRSKSKSAKAAKVAKAAKPAKLPKKKKKPEGLPELAVAAQVLSSDVVYKGPMFRVMKDRIIEPGGKEGVRDVIRHNGSAVILAVDNSKSKKDPWIVIERQYRHAAQQFLWELPAGSLDAGEDPLAGAQRELEEETGYRAKKWKPLARYFASPGFLGEAMNVFLAEGLMAGDARPEDDEDIEFRLVKLSEIMKMIRKGAILDGKTLSCVLLYQELLRKK